MATINVKVGADSANRCNVHHLPCHISHDGPAKVSTYFVPRAQEDGTYIAHFRGRKLDGNVVELPANVTGWALREDTMAQAAAASAAASSSSAPERWQTMCGAGASDEAADDDFGLPAGFGSDDDGCYGSDDDWGSSKAKAGNSGTGGGASGGSSTAAGGAARTGDTVLATRFWVVDGSFRSCISWQHDKAEDGSDLLPTAVGWMQVARAIHA